MHSQFSNIRKACYLNSIRSFSSFTVWILCHIFEHISNLIILAKKIYLRQNFFFSDMVESLYIYINIYILVSPTPSIPDLHDIFYLILYSWDHQTRVCDGSCGRNITPYYNASYLYCWATLGYLCDCIYSRSDNSISRNL